MFDLCRTYNVILLKSYKYDFLKKEGLSATSDLSVNLTPESSIAEINISSRKAQIGGDAHFGKSRDSHAESSGQNMNKRRRSENTPTHSSKPRLASQTSTESAKLAHFWKYKRRKSQKNETIQSDNMSTIQVPSSSKSSDANNESKVSFPPIREHRVKLQVIILL